MLVNILYHIRNRCIVRVELRHLLERGERLLTASQVLQELPLLNLCIWELRVDLDYLVANLYCLLRHL